MTKKIEGYAEALVSAGYEEVEAEGKTRIFVRGETGHNLREVKVNGRGQIKLNGETAEIGDCTKAGGGVVAAKYHRIYRERGNPRHCGDWLAESLEGVFDNGKGLDVKAFSAFLKANGVDLKGAWADLPTSGQPGWQGRYRMNGRQKLQRRVLETGKLVWIDAKTKAKVEEAAPEAWLLEMATKLPKVDTSAWAK